MHKIFEFFEFINFMAYKIYDKIINFIFAYFQDEIKIFIFQKAELMKSLLLTK